MKIGGISVVYQWRSAVKFDGITSGILVVYQWNIGGVTSGFHWYISGIPVVSIGITVVL